MSKEKSAWELLSSIDVSSKIEKKSNLSYLSWAWAWGVLKANFPDASFIKHHSPATGMPYFADHNGFAFVRVTVSLGPDLETVTEFLPVLDHRNKAIQNPDSFAINNSLQRCLVKAIAYIGLGHYIYAGEDLPEDYVSVNTTNGSAVTGISAERAISIDSTAVDIAPKLNGLSVIHPDGKSEVADTVGTIAVIFTTFIPSCKTESDLNKFYKDNSLALAFMKERSVETHKEVLDLFTARKKELKNGL